MLKNHEWQYLCETKEVASCFPNGWMVDSSEEEVYITDTDEDREFVIPPTNTLDLDFKYQYKWKRQVYENALKNDWEWERLSAQRV